MDKLLEAYKLLLEKVEIIDKTPQIQTIVKDRFTVTDKVIELTARIRKENRISLFSLFSQDFTKTELLNVFLAVLEIVKKQIAIAEQTGFQDDIIIIHSDEDKQTDEELLNDVDEYN